MINRPRKTAEFEFLNSALAVQLQSFTIFLDRLLDSSAFLAAPSGSQEIAAVNTVEFNLLVADVIAEVRRIGQRVSATLPELSDETIHDFQYVLAAWADEATIKFGQTRLSVEQRGSVESGLFGTVRAGDELFKKIEKTVGRRSADDVVLAGAYLLALMAGFEGRYLGGAGAKELQRYGDALQAIATRKTADGDKYDTGAAASIAAAQPPRDRIFGRQVRLPLLIGAFLMFLMVILIALEIHWEDATHEVARKLQDMSFIDKSVVRSNQEPK